MRKKTKKIVNRLSMYIGFEIIRTKPTLEEDFSHTREPILLTGFTSDGRIRYRYVGMNAYIFGNEEFILPLSFTDRNWITLKKALKAEHNALNEWRGKKIKRICPTATGDHSFIYEYDWSKPPTLISASRHHMVIMSNDAGLEGRKAVLNFDFVNSKDWVLAE